MLRFLDERRTRVVKKYADGSQISPGKSPRQEPASMHDKNGSPMMEMRRDPETRQNYNFSHSSTRTAVERSIGVTKRWWHCLRRLRASPQKACQIIVVEKMVALSSPTTSFSTEGLSDHRCGKDGGIVFADYELLHRRLVRSSL